MILNNNFQVNNNPNLYCIKVDNVDYSTTHWSNIDSQTNFSEHCYDCSGTVTEFDSQGWSNGVPSQNSLVFINDTYQVGQEGNIDACACIIKQGGYLRIESNSYVKIDDDIINNGLVEVFHQGSFVQTNQQAKSIGHGTFTIHLQTTQLDDPSRFTYFSSPVQNQDLTVFNSWARMDRLWRFDESIQDWYQVPSTTVMTPAVGFAIQGNVDTGQYPFIGYANFNGPFNNGVYSYPLAYNSGGIDDDNTLVGNPYPSAIDATLLLNNNPSANAFYFWTHKSGILPNGSAYASDDYAIWNNSGGIASASGSPSPTGYIASGQGFFVEATANGTLTFDNSLRVTGNNTDFRMPTTENRERIWLNLEHEDYGVFNQILLNFNENGTTNFDAKLDAYRFNLGNAISFHSNGLNQESFAIQALAIITEDTVVPLGFEVNNQDITHLKISIDHSELNVNTIVYLKDNQENILYNLSQSDYNFTTTLGDYNTRFELLFRRNSLNIINTNQTNEGLLVSNYSDSQIKINTKKGTNFTEIKLFDVLGKEILKTKENTNSTILTTNIKQGTILIIKVQLENGKILVKKFIKE